MSCDYCDSHVPLRHGWHELRDPEGIEGDWRIPCPDNPPEEKDIIKDYDYETEGLGGT